MISFLHVHTTIRPKYEAFLYLFFLCTTIRPRLRVLTYLIFLNAHNHLIKTCGPLPFIITFELDHSTKVIRVLIYIFISFVHDHSTKIRGHSYSLLYLLCRCFVPYIHGSTYIFRTLYLLWHCSYILYAMFMAI